MGEIISIEDLERMYDEVINYYSFDLGELPKDEVNRINVETTSTDIDRKIVLDNVIRKLYVLLINGNNKKIDEKFHSFGTHTIELYDINQRKQEIENDLRKPQSIINLKKIYLEKSKPLILLAADKIRIEKNKRQLQNKRWYKDIIKDVIIAVAFYLLGKYL